MDGLSSELARVKAERKKLQKTEWQRQRWSLQRKARAWFIGSIAYCHVPEAGDVIAAALVRKYGEWLEGGIQGCRLELDKKFLETRVDTLASWLDWETDRPASEVEEAKRLVQEVRLHKMGAGPEL